MAKKEPCEIINNKLCIGANRLISIAKSLYFSELNDKHKITEFCEEGMPFIKAGKERKFILEDVLRWYVEEKMGLDELKAVKLKTEIGRISAQTEKINLDYKIAKKEFVSVAEVSKSQAELITFLKTQDKNSLNKIKDTKTRKILDDFYKKKWEIIGEELEKLQGGDIDSNAQND